MSENTSRSGEQNKTPEQKRKTHRIISRIAAGLLTAVLVVPCFAGFNPFGAKEAAGEEGKLNILGKLDRFDRDGLRPARNSFAPQVEIDPEIIQIGTPRPIIGPVIEIDPEATEAPDSGSEDEEEIIIIRDPEIVPVAVETEKPTEAPSEVGKTTTKDIEGIVPGAILYFNYQNHVIITDTENDWFSGLPTQKGLYQITAEYKDGEGSVFRFLRNNKNPDPMIYLPVYDICYNINLKNYPYVAVCYKSTAADQDGHFYFATTANEGLDESKNISISMPHSDDWTVTVAKAGKNSNWTGRLSTLRFDIAGGDFAGEFTVKWLAFFKTRDEANAFGAQTLNPATEITPEKTEFARGEDITFSVASYYKGDWVALVQEGDACYTGSTHDPDLYISNVMPLYWENLENETCTFNLNETRGIYNHKLLPAGDYDLVLYSHNSYVELARTTITITEEIANEPEVTETVYVTRAPETEVPVTPEETYEPTDEPEIVTATASPKKTAEPETAGSSNKAGLVIGMVCAILCAAALAIFFVARKKKQS